MTTWQIFLFVYVLGVVLAACFSVALVITRGTEDQEAHWRVWAVRLAALAPVWPWLIWMGWWAAAKQSGLFRRDRGRLRAIVRVRAGDGLYEHQNPGVWAVGRSRSGDQAWVNCDPRAMNDHDWKKVRQYASGDRT